MVIVVLETEAKLRINCSMVDALHSRLLELGFRISWSGEEEDVYYYHPCRDIIETDEAIRVRRSSRGKRLTYKGPRIGSRLKSRVEYEADVNGDIESILEALGFRPAVSVKKHRTVYKGLGVTVTLDNVYELGCFVEVEDLGGGEERIIDIIKKLRLNPEGIIKDSYAALLLRSRGRGR